jgi:hypothetical protein
MLLLLLLRRRLSSPLLTSSIVQQFGPFYLPLVIRFLAVLLLETRVSCLVYSSASFYSLAVLLFGKKQGAHRTRKEWLFSLSLSLSRCALHFYGKVQTSNQKQFKQQLSNTLNEVPKEWNI